MPIQAVTTIDFETNKIQDRPTYPPRPVGVSVQFPGERRPTYYAWGHPTRNNCTAAHARDVLRKAWGEAHAGRVPLLFQNAKFDLEVAEVAFGLEPPAWDQIHDTLFLLFLSDPRAPSLSLKPSAERILGMPATEQETLKAWILDHVFTEQPGGEGAVKVADVRPSGWYHVPTSKFGAFIAQAPGDLVGEYAKGDVVRTLKLYRKLYPEIMRRGMGAAYDRERRLLPILLENEQQGILVDHVGLSRDLKKYEAAQHAVEAWLRKRLKTPELDFGKGVEVADALESRGVVTEFAATKTGKRSVSKKTLTADVFSDRKIFLALGYRNRLDTCLTTFYRPWLAMSAKDGYLRTAWNQVRGENYGTRTGRLSSNHPNFQNVPKTFDDKNDGYAHPDFLELPELPLMRQYLLPDRNTVWLHRDYSQQELRILAHFEDGTLLLAYQNDPSIDVHVFVQSEIKRLRNLDLPRRAVKIVNFGMLYGMGLAKLAESLSTTVEEARKIKDAQRAAIPGLAELERLIRALAAAGEPIRTWGGREYFKEPDKLDEKTGRMRSFEYKLLNDLIQGSAADCTKEAVIRYHNHPKREGRFLVTVHDELNSCVVKSLVKQEMALKREVMASVEFDLPMLSDGKTGPSWASLTKFKEGPL